MKTIRRYTEITQAYLAQSVLDSEGILTYIKNENTIAVYPLYSGAVGYLELQVEAADVERALEILGPEKEDREEVDKLTKRANKSILILLSVGLIVGAISWASYSFDMEYFGEAFSFGMVGTLVAGLVLWLVPRKEEPPDKTTE